MNYNVPEITGIRYGKIASRFGWSHIWPLHNRRVSYLDGFGWERNKSFCGLTGPVNYWDDPNPICEACLRAMSKHYQNIHILEVLERSEREHDASTTESTPCTP